MSSSPVLSDVRNSSRIRLDERRLTGGVEAIGIGFGTGSGVGDICCRAGADGISLLDIRVGVCGGVCQTWGGLSLRGVGTFAFGICLGVGGFFRIVTNGSGFGSAGVVICVFSA